MAGEPRLTAHGSGGGSLVAGGAAVPGGGFAGPAVIAADVGLVACGVLATVESPDPHPASVATAIVAAASAAARWVRTPGTVPSSRAGVRQAWPPGRHTLDFIS